MRSSSVLLLWGCIEDRGGGVWRSEEEGGGQRRVLEDRGGR